jgi:hypothetical protein
VRRSTPRRSVTKPPVTQTDENTAAAPPLPVAPKVDLRTPAAGATPNKPVAPVSPQMISPPKTQQPKAKVIQWP